MSGPDIEGLFPLGDPDPANAKHKWSVRMDVRSAFAADAATQVNHHVSMDVEAEFKARQGRKLHYYVRMDVESPFGANSG